MATYLPNQLYQVPLAELQPDPMQPRKFMDPLALEELTASVRQMGIIEPVVCRQDPATSLVYAVLFIDGANHAEISLVENLLRQDLNPVEEAEALQRLMDNHAYQQDQLAKIIGKSPATISQSLSLNRLPREVRDECRQDPTVPKNVLVEIARKKQERSMLTKFKQYRDLQAKIAAKKTDPPSAGPRRRNKAEALVNSIGIFSSRIGDLEFPDFSTEDRTTVIDAMTSLKDALDEAIDRAVKNKKKPM